MREAILTFLEKNSRIDLQELAVILGTDEATVANEIAKMEQEHIICGYHTLIDWDKTLSRQGDGSYRGAGDSPERPGL